MAEGPRDGYYHPERSWSLEGFLADLTHAEVIEMLESRRTTFAALHEQMRIDELFLLACAVIDTFGVNAIADYLSNFPDGFPIKVPSLLVDAVERQVNLLLVGETPIVDVLLPPNLHIGPDKEQRMRDDRDELKRILRALLSYIESYSAESPLRPAAFHLIALGMCVIAYPISRDRWPEHPFKVRGTPAAGQPYLTKAPRNPKEEQRLKRWERSRLGALPFDVHAVHPMTAFFDPYNEPMEDMIEEQYVDAAAFAKRYPQLELSPRGSGTNDSKLVIYCSADWWGMWLDGIPFLKGKNVNEDGMAENTTGVLWYKMAYGGHGYLSHKREWVYRIQGLVRGARDEMRSLITDFNAQEHLKSNYLFPPVDILVTGDEGVEEAERYHQGVASKWIHTDAAKIIREEIRQFPQGFFTMESLTRGLFEGHTGSNVLGGNWEGQETLGGIQSRQGLAKGGVRSPKQSMEQALQGMLSDMVYMQTLPELGEPLWLPTVKGYETLKPDRIPPATRFVVELSPPTPEDRQRQLQADLLRVEAGTLSQRTVMERDPDIEDVDEEMVRVDSDRVMRQGDTLKLVSEAATQKFQAWVAGQKNGAAEVGPEMAEPEPAAPTATVTRPPQIGTASVPPPTLAGG